MPLGRRVPEALNSKIAKLMLFYECEYSNCAPVGDRIEVDVEVASPASRETVRLKLTWAERDADPTQPLPYSDSGNL